MSTFYFKSKANVIIDLVIIIKISIPNNIRYNTANFSSAVQLDKKKHLQDYPHTLWHSRFHLKVFLFVTLGISSKHLV